MSNHAYVYLLESTTGATYIGATIDLDRRLRQHNKEIKGGAHATGSRVARGEIWNRVAYVAGFPDWQAALQFEWRWKNLSRTNTFRSIPKPLNRRLAALNRLLSLAKSTEKAVPFCQWPEPPRVHLEHTDTFLTIL
jgi:structure-specific endonuclease subunit SLX1